MACKYYFQHPDKKQNLNFCKKDGQPCPHKAPAEYKCLKAIQKDDEDGAGKS